MASVIQVKRRINGAVATPSTAGVKEGEIAVNAPGAAGTGTKAYLYFYDGVAWRTANPDVTISTQSINLTSSAGADIGAAYTAWATTPANTITGNVVIATWGTPAQAYVLTNSSAPGVAASWTSLGGAVSFASATEIHTGSDTTKAINSAILRGETRDTPSNVANLAADEGRIPRLRSLGTLDPHFIPQPAPAGAGGVGGDVAAVIAGTAVNMFLTPAGLEMRVAHTPNATPANDQNKLPALDAGGKIPAGFLPAGGLTFSGAVDLTVTKGTQVAATVKAGDMFTVSKDGVLFADWAGVMATLTAGASVKAGDMVIYDGSKFHHIANTVDTSGLVPRAGAVTMAATASWTFAPAAAGATIINGGANLPKVENVTLDMGTF